MISRMSADQCSTQLLRILEQSLDTASELEDLLHDERNILESQNSNELMAITSTKDRCVQVLEKLETERKALCTACGFGSNQDGMQDVLNWCDSNSVVTAIWNRLLTNAKVCDGLNRTNGAIGRIRYEHVMSALAVLHGSNNKSTVYGSQGQEPARHEQRELALI